MSDSRPDVRSDGLVFETGLPAFDREATMIADGWVVERTREDGSRMWFRDGTGIWDEYAETRIGPTPCRECGDHFRVEDRESGPMLCFTCDYWLSQLAKPELALIKPGWLHCRDTEPGGVKPGHGGLWGQGVIPERFRDRFAEVHDYSEVEV